ncbi:MULTISPECIES: hydratase [Ramlibacter]|uniref:Hydratase n=1 Tax=Ramlibacter aquaticus TaxID=2780094 RepID=A0ABR9SHY1_9BURK|nr:MULTISPECIES: hydratase [Ramlibacter]MBE7941885.1 hydratase [Ramlibacter aquaticus]
MEDPAFEAARLLADGLRHGKHLEVLPASCRPLTRAQGYAVQALWPGLLGDTVAGWKIAATSAAGQAHIAVTGPLAGPVFASRVQPDGAVLSLAANRMRVAECEIVFRMDRALAPRSTGWRRAEVLEAVASLHPGIEAPDSRFLAFERAGEAQLIADCACTQQMVVGAGVAPDERVHALPALRVQAQVSDGRSPEGLGRNVLGDPVEALVWLVNELGTAGQVLEAGQFVTTGACVPPIPVHEGLRVQADFGWIGRVSAGFA